MTVRHEDFCENPKIIFKTLRQKLLAHGFEMHEDYTFAKNFEQSRLEEEMKAYEMHTLNSQPLGEF